MAFAPHEIPDSCARYLQDFLLDQVGLLRNRGTVQPAVTVATFPDDVVGITQTASPANIHKVGVLHGTNKFGVTNDTYTSYTDVYTGFTLDSSPYSIVDAKPALGGGSLIGVYDQNGGTKQLAYWRGAEKAAYTTGTVTVTRGSKAVTGVGTSWASTVTPGMFLFATASDPAGVSVYMGVVLQVNSDTSLTLEENARFASAGGTYALNPLRAVMPYYRCRLTSDTASTTLTGSSTKFVGNAIATGTWYAFRAADNAYIGKVSSVTNDTTIVLTAAASIAVEVEDCLLIRAGHPATIAAPVMGGLTAVYAERQFYADGTNVYFSEAGDFEAIDLDPFSGNFVEVSSAAVGASARPITGIAPSYNALLIAKENEAFSLIGPTPSQFVLRKLLDDGALSTMSVQVLADGNVIFGGREGIYAYDGQQAANIVEDRLGDYYKALVRTFDPNTYRMWSMVSRDHYFLFIESVTASYGPIKGSSMTPPTRMTIAIHLPTRAVTFQTNMDIRGAIELPASTSRGTWYIVNTASGGRICAANDFFETTAADGLTCTGNTAGPDYYIESKRYGLGDDLRKKLFKQLAMEYYVGGDNLKMDTVVGLNDNGTTSLSEWVKSILSWDSVSPVAPTWDQLEDMYDSWDDLGQARFVVKRIKFLKRSQHLGFRIYMASSDVTAVKLGPWSIGFKLQREGRI